MSADARDESLATEESTNLLFLDQFGRSVYILFFADGVLRQSSDEYEPKILAQSAKQGFPIMLVSVDFYKWEWKDYPVARHGQFNRNERFFVTTLKAIAGSSLWIITCIIRHSRFM